MNSLNIVGRLVNDPESRQTKSGATQSKFRVAVNRDFKNSEGQYDADFFNVVAWRGTADFCNRYLSKGRLVEINGRVQTGNYEKDGVKHYTFDVMVNTIKPLDRAQDAQATQSAAPQTMAQQGFEEVDEPVDLPF